MVQVQSPFLPFVNAQLRFEVAGGGLVTDLNGNPIPGTAILEVKAVLQQQRNPNREIRPGVDPTSIWVEGFLVSPLELPGNVTPDSPCEMIWQGRRGRFWLEFSAKNAYLDALNIQLVNRLKGYFLPGSFVVNGPVWTPPSLEVNELYTEPLLTTSGLSAHRICALTSSGVLVHASATTLEHAYSVLGLTTGAALPGQRIRLLKEGNVTNETWNWLPGEPLFLGTDGMITQTPPTSATAAFMLTVGQVIMPDSIQVEIEDPLIFGAVP